MLVILGVVIVMGAVFGGFALDDGHLAALYQPYELLMIGGGALGAFVIANDRKSITATLRALPTLFHTSKYTRALYLELMSLLYDILTKVRKEGLMSLEADIDAPANSAIFARYPKLIAAALVGTFLGILLSYGVVGPLASLLQRKLQESSKLYECIKVTLIASLNGYAPMLAVEFGRKVISATERPSFPELEAHFKQAKARA
jgi:chemotaxis protein MotA